MMIDFKKENAKKTTNKIYGWDGSSSRVDQLLKEKAKEQAIVNGKKYKIQKKSGENKC